MWLSERITALENVVVASFATNRACRTKLNRPLSAATQAIAAQRLKQLQPSSGPSSRLTGHRFRRVPAHYRKRWDGPMSAADRFCQQLRSHLACLKLAASAEALPAALKTK